MVQIREVNQPVCSMPLGKRSLPRAIMEMRNEEWRYIQGFLGFETGMFEVESL